MKTDEASTDTLGGKGEIMDDDAAMF